MSPNIKGEKRYEKEILLGKVSQLKVRLIGKKLTSAQSAARKKRANKLAKSHGYKISQKNKALLNWSIFITNAPTNKLTGEQIVSIYRARWQIE